MRRLVCSAAIVVLLFTACSPKPSSRSQPEDRRLLHVHGLGINPADGALFVATHYGLFRMDFGDGDRGSTRGEPEPVRVGDSRRDIMGFTIVGSNHFLASGHPDVEEMNETGAPPLLGLIESRDAGVTWQTLSLRGSADFHAIRVAGGEILGFNSTASQFMASPNGRSWEVRSNLVLFDFAVSDAAPDLVVATTNAGVVSSRDGGRTWSEPAPPAIATLSWTEGAFWGMSPEGLLYHSPDGSEWHEMGRFSGRPAAFLATPRAFYLATHEASVYISEDVGVTWKPVYTRG